MSVPRGPVRAIYFDAVGTLIHPEPPATEVYAAVGRRFGSGLDSATIAELFRTAFADEEQRDWASGLRVSEERELVRWQTIVRRVLHDVAHPQACFQALYQHFSQPAAWRVEPDAASVIGTLTEHGYHLGICSNFDHRLHGVLAGLLELRALERVVISSEIGWRKPAAAFFEALTRQVALNPSQVLVAGDDLANDFQGARQAGLAAVLFDPRRRSVNQVAARIDKLSELPDLLAKRMG
jgi:putative hydrolase of the HAD superfamily